MTNPTKSSIKTLDHHRNAISACRRLIDHTLLAFNPSDRLLTEIAETLDKFWHKQNIKLSGLENGLSDEREATVHQLIRARLIMANYYEEDDIWVNRLFAVYRCNQLAQEILNDNPDLKELESQLIEYRREANDEWLNRACYPLAEGLSYAGLEEYTQVELLNAAQESSSRFRALWHGVLGD